MFNPFRPVELIKTQVLTTMPAKFRNKQKIAWATPNRQGAEIECFLEGPSFDREGRLWLVDIPFGRIFRISLRQGEWELITQYDGWPNGLKFDKEGYAWICDYKAGLLKLDAKTGNIEAILGSMYSEGFKGLNDLHFATNGDLYFTDQGQTGIADPTGRVFRLRANGALDRLALNVPSPNGITLTTREALLCRGDPLAADLAPAADGRRLGVEDRRGDPAFRRRGRPRRHRDGCRKRPAGLPPRRRRLAVRRQHAADAPDPLENPHHHHLANIACGGADSKTLYITESLSGDILTAPLPVAGKRMFGLSCSGTAIAKPHMAVPGVPSPMPAGPGPLHARVTESSRGPHPRRALARRA